MSLVCTATSRNPGWIGLWHGGYSENTSCKSSLTS